MLIITMRIATVCTSVEALLLASLYNVQAFQITVSDTASCEKLLVREEQLHDVLKCVEQEYQCILLGYWYRICTRILDTCSRPMIFGCHYIYTLTISID